MPPLARPATMAGLATLAASIFLLSSSAPAVAAPEDRITSLVAGAGELFALRGNTVVTFDAGGRESARCRRFDTPPLARQPRPPAGPIDAQEALRLAGLPDDDLQTQEAEDVLAAEGLIPRRASRAPADAPIVAHALAASPSVRGVWIATSAGLYRGHGRACTRVALPGRDVIAVASAGDAVVAATEDLLWRSTDGGITFRVAAGMVARPRALAIVDDERTLVANDDGVIEVGPYRVVRTVLDRGSSVLAVCDGLALAFASDGAWSWRGDAAAERAGDRPAARTLTCGDGAAARFIATGDSVYASADGAAWRERPALPGRSFAAAVIGNRIWLAADDRVVALDDLSTSYLESFAGPPPPPMPALTPLPTRRLVGPTFPWPQVSIVFTGQHTALRDGWSLVAVLVFRLGRAATAGIDGPRLAAEIVQRDAALAAQENELATAPDNDPSRTALLRAIRQEREALR